jgi:hypothetical protein
VPKKVKVFVPFALMAWGPFVNPGEAGAVLDTSTTPPARFPLVTPMPSMVR